MSKTEERIKKIESAPEQPYIGPVMDLDPDEVDWLISELRKTRGALKEINAIVARAEITNFGINIKDKIRGIGRLASAALEDRP